MSIEIWKPLFTTRGGVVRGIFQCADELYPLVGVETFEGVERNGIWTNEGKSHRDGAMPQLDLTNTPPADQLRETPGAQPDLTAENAALKAKVAELEVLLRQSHKENAEAWKVAVKWQRVAAKGAAR